MWTRWLPWRYVLSRVARSQGFIDPVAVLSRLHRFAQPSEVAEPIELLRAGVVFHARGLINTRAIQHNLDWVWPYWVARQFDPTDPSFIPRAFSITHVNLSHRNWTAVGLPDCDELPIVDPRGLMTPILDGWSLDAWVVPEEGGAALIPSQEKEAIQRLFLEPRPVIETKTQRDGLRLRTRADVASDGDGVAARLTATAASDRPAWIVISARPTNPEGVSFIHKIKARQSGRRWTLDEGRRIEFDAAPDRVSLSDYRRGDVAIHLHKPFDADEIECNVGLATGAAMFRMTPGEEMEVEAQVPIASVKPERGPRSRDGAISDGAAGRGGGGSIDIDASWRAAMASTCRMEAPDEWMRFLFDASLRTMVLHSPGDVYPGPYTYKRFWFRDASFILDAMLALGMTERVERVLATYPARQQSSGYFRSQKGEWDSNGEAIWILHRFARRSGRSLTPRQIESVRKGADWIRRKRLPKAPGDLHSGLLPAGFSAEHLGPNDHYYWDAFWSVAGLESASALLAESGEKSAARDFLDEAKDLRESIDASIERGVKHRDRPGVPAAPSRRMDAGAIGSIVCAYPLGLWQPTDDRLLATVDFLIDNCFVHDGFFQDMIHSGVNSYLTLHVAQSLLRAGDPLRAWRFIEEVARLASPTGQWPEAIHPLTDGGCMGDGQHVWAAAEWALMMRNCFIREEGDGLIIGQGLPAKWLDAKEPLSFGPTLTDFGAVRVQLTPRDGETHVRWEAEWRDAPPMMEVRLEGAPPAAVDPEAGEATVRRVSGADRAAPTA